MDKEKRPITHDDVDNLVRHLEDEVRRMRGDPEPDYHKNDEKTEEEEKNQENSRQDTI